MPHDHANRRNLPDRASSLPAFTARAAVVATPSWKLAVDLIDAELADSGRPDAPPDVLLVFINDLWQEHFPALLQELHQRTGARAIVGGSASGVLANAHEYEGIPGISCLALWMPGVIATPVRLHQESLPLLDEPALWHQSTGVDPDRLRGAILLADPYRMDAHALVGGLGRCYPGVPLVGGMTSASAHRRRTWVFLDDHVYDEGGVVLMLQGAVSLVPMVSQGAEPVGEAWTITAVDRNTILEISNRPALDVLLDTACDLYGAQDRDAFPFGDWMIGFATNEYQERFGRGDFTVRGMLGGDHARKGIVVGGVPRVGQTVQFQIRDAALAHVDLRQHLLDLRAGLVQTPAAAGLLFTCNGRGESVFGRPDHDAESVATLLRDLPVAGMFCDGEIGPASPGGGPALHGFSATLGLLVPDPLSS